MNVYENIVTMLDTYNIDYKLFEHGEIISYEDAERERLNHKWEGVESKNVFMTNKKGDYFLYVTTQGTKVDFKQMKEITGEKLSLASNQDVENIIHCVPGCVSPFGFDVEITTIVDRSVFSFENYLFSPGVTTKTIQLSPKDLEQVFIDTGCVFL
ncbi:DNA-binding protein [Candidatus Gracilibacteria bacterium]|nr:DNA-binding protein [Candidatus Gracilibacteria bacterium]